LAVAPYDEPKIGDEDVIIRRINPDQHVVWDDNRKQKRISSKAYNKSTGLNEGMSVDVEALIMADGLDPRIYVQTPVFTGAVAFSASVIRTLDLWVGYDPVRDHHNAQDNPYHGQVWSREQKKKFSEVQKSGLARAANWYVEIPGVAVE
jgi:hypothetical protein